MTRAAKRAPRRMAVTGWLAIVLASALMSLATIAAYAEQGPVATRFNNATVWIGLKNSDDIQTLFDVEVRVYNKSEQDPGAYLLRGLRRCISGVARDPRRALEVDVPLDGTQPAGSIRVRVFARIGTNDNETRCASPHSSASGLRIYYDASDRPSRVEGSETLYLHTTTTDILDTAPGVGPVRFKDSVAVSYAKLCTQAEKDDGLCMTNGKNPFKQIGGVTETGWLEEFTNLRRHINDLYAFRSPANADNTVLIMTVSPFSTATTPSTFEENTAFEFRIANQDLINTTDDITFRVTFGAPDGNGVQDVTLRGSPATLFPPDDILAQGKTNQNLAVQNVGGTGAMFRAGEHDDPARFDAVGFEKALNFQTFVSAIQAGAYPRGTSPNGFGPGSTPNFDAPNFFGPSVNSLAIILEVPSAVLRGASGNGIGVWARTEVNGVQVDRMGRPAINTALIPPVPRGSNFPIGGTTDQNRQERRNAFNAGHPKDDRTSFRADMVSVLTAYYPAGRPGGNPSTAQAGVLADLLLPDILVFDTSSSAGFGTSFSLGGLGNGRKLSDDALSTDVAILADDDLPATFGGGPNPPAVVTQNVRDDNGSNLTDGSINPPPPQGTGAAGTGTVRSVAFPYIGARNTNPTGLPPGAPALP